MSFFIAKPLKFEGAVIAKGLGELKGRVFAGFGGFPGGPTPLPGLLAVMAPDIPLLPPVFPGAAANWTERLDTGVP
jgi:hypothetical protein